MLVSTDLIAADRSRTIQPTSAVQNQTSIRLGSVAVLLPLRNICEAVQHFFRPLAAFLFRRTQFEHRSAVAAVERIAGRTFSSAKLRCPIQIASTVKYQWPAGQVAILPAPEVVQHGFRPCPTLLSRRRKLEYRAASRRCPEQHTWAAAAVTRDSVEVPCVVCDQTARWTRPVVLVVPLEHVQHLFRPRATLLLRWAQLVDRAAPPRRTGCRAAIDG